MNTHDLVKQYQENLALATYLTKRWLANTPPQYHEDLFAEARLGLWKACQTFDQSKGFKFGTYAGRIISNQIGQFYRKIRKSFDKEWSLQSKISDIENISLEDSIGYEPDFDSAITKGNILKIVKKYRLLSLRYLKNIGQTEIGEMLGCSQAQVSRKMKIEKANLLAELREVM